ncbi:MAG: methyltransferase domain-containing protein [Chloroflexi bacterium]|nr:methyltransferase domain-containing protein [Chloroflexota bacterium]
MSFAVAAEAYDRYMGRYSALLSPQLADFAGVRAGQRALDVGSGPGALTGELAGRLGPGSVAAVDPSESFVAAARDRLPGVEVHLATAEQLPFEPRTFDAALAQLVVHFMADPLAGLTEMARVTRGGGVVAACVWDFAGGRGPLGPFWEAAHELDPAVVDESDLAGARDGHLVELLTKAGLSAVEQGELTIATSHSTFDAWWAPFTQGVGPGGAYVARLSEEHRAALRERCRALLPPAPFELSAVAWAARGRP